MQNFRARVRNERYVVMKLVMKGKVPNVLLVGSRQDRHITFFLKVQH